MKILIDNGHGVDTPGKRSPNGALLEYDYTRTIALRLADRFLDEGYDVELVCPERYDVSLASRVARVNKICRQFGSKQCLLVSIHNDAAGSDGQWHNARGWSVRVAPNSSVQSKVFASILAQSAENKGLHVRRYQPNVDYWIQNLYILKKTNCPAVLTENLFMDNQDDCKFLLSDEGINTIMQLHYDAIITYINKYEKK